jgi:phosphoglucomutase/phosphomannomutase
MAAFTVDLQDTLARIDKAVGENRLSKSAAANIRSWLTEARYAEYAQQVAEHVRGEKWQCLDDVFWTVIPFGTGGRRGRMYPIGSNAINDRTIGESAQGLAEYVSERHQGKPLSCAIAFDTRHRSEDFARLCAEIMVANGFTVYYLAQYRSTPELSFLVRYKNCACGIMVTASHNPPSDNAVKVYWSTGGQILPPHDEEIIRRVMNVDRIHRTEFAEALAQKRIVVCTEEVDSEYISQVKSQAFPGPRDVKIIYSPLHGVGATSVLPVLAADGFRDVELFAEHAQPDGDFPNVPNHVANPENPAVFDIIIDRARTTRADIVLATDPDCDRLGVAASSSWDASGSWTFTGNQIGALLVDYVLEQRQKAGTLTASHYVVKTLVTTEMIRRIADSYGVRTIGDLHVGFKWIGGVMDAEQPDKFVFGTEESHGYLVGHYARDKDGAVAAMLLAELAALCKSQRRSLHEKLDALYWQHGYHAEHLMTQQMPGSEGMARMQALMSKFRSDPPRTLGGLPVSAIRDYENNRILPIGGSPQELRGPRGDLVIFDLAESGNYVAARPSGTEPKVKFYMFAYVAPELLADLDQAKQQMAERIDRIKKDLQSYAESV